VTLTAHPRPLRGVLAVLTLLLPAIAVLALGATPAEASTCATPGHAYLTKPGALFFSGFDGDQRFGIPTFNTFRGDSFRAGGNGIAPGNFINFFAVNQATGQPVDFTGNGDPLFRFTTDFAGLNCVANEVGPFSVQVPDGRYRISAQYSSGNAGFITDQVVDVVVSESNRPQPRPRPNPCGAAATGGAATLLLPSPC